ncbi:MAG TPA: DUF3971 domain-containing protein [Xanthobacteraceae bacterium]|jgi:hypothetical protein|nr:DUF3971 domain-containing protein [Xanthobacteraceae bacterium]
MAPGQLHLSLEALRKLEASLKQHLCEQHPPGEGGDEGARASPSPLSAAICGEGRTRLRAWCPRLRQFAIVGGTVGGLVMLALVALWWRLSSGPIELDIATPWLTAAIKENFGAGHEVEIGGTQLERDANKGRTSLRIRDIVVRDADGTIVASAPKAEVGISGASLFLGRIHAERLSLVGAEMAVRIESDSEVTVFAGSNKRPLVTASAVPASAVVPRMGPPPKPEQRGTPVVSAVPAAPLAPATPASARNGIPDLAALIAWIESLDASGLDGRDLTEIGLQGGNLTVDDQRNGKQWTFTNIDLSVTRPKGGGIAVTLGSQGGERPWHVRAAMTPGQQPGHRIIDVETQKLSTKDVMLAMRVSADQYEIDLPLSGRIRADVGPDGVPHMLDGRVLVEKGIIVDLEDPLVRIPIERAEISLDWDKDRRALTAPFQIVSGGNRITLLAQFDAPSDGGGTWGLQISGGSAVLAAAPADPNALILNRVLLRLRIDANKQRIDLEPSELGNTDLGVALTGSLDFSSDDPRLALGIAGTRMSVAALKRLWPLTVAPKVRAWVIDHVQAGTVERLDISTNALWSTLKSSGPPLPDDGLLIQITANGAEVRPVEGLPAIRDADVNVHVSGRTAVINVGRGNVDISPGRKLSITNGSFEVPDTFPKAPPAKARFRLDGSVPAAVELLNMQRLRDYSGAPVESATSRGTLTAQVTLALPLKEDLPPGSTLYTINMDVANFAAERMVMGQKVEAQLLKVTANNVGHWIRGDVKINGIASVLDYRKPRDGDADVRVQTTLDEAARSKFGFDLGGLLTGPVPIKLSGRVAANDGDSRFAMEADLSQAKIDNLLPGWLKPPGRPARASFTMINKPGSTRIEDLMVEGAGASVKGTVEVDASGDVVSANFPAFALADGDKATLKAERSGDGALRVTMRGDVFDARGFVKSTLTGPASSNKQKQDKDIDVDVKIATVIGFNGETLRGLDLRASRRGGVITSLALNGKLGRDAPLTGELRGRGRQVIVLESNDAGAFFRFNDIYPKLTGGEMWVALDPQSAELSPQEGTLNIRDFVVRGETALERVAAAPQQAGGQSGVEFSRLWVQFTRSTGRFTIRDGLLKGPAIGGTVDGYIDYHRDEVRMRGTFVPLYGLNNMFGQLPIVGPFLGGSNEGLLGVTYEVVGPPSTPVLRVNPISAVAPGLLRKFFEFPGGNVPLPAQSYAEPGRY